MIAIKTFLPKRPCPFLNLVAIFSSLFFLPWTLAAQTFSPPELPRSYVKTKFELPTDGTTWRVNAGGNLQAAINSAQPGDIIELEAGITFSGNFVFPRKEGEGWIYIISSKLSDLPTEGVRVSPASAGNMAKIETGNSLPAIRTAFGAGYLRFVGIEITSRFSATTSNLVILGYESRYAATDSEFAHHVIFDRCYLHGEGDRSITRAINGSGKHIALINSWVAKIHVVGQDTQAFGAWHGPGPYKIYNNFLEASGENIMFGGAIPTGEFPVVPIPADIEIRSNYFYKPLSWKVGDPNYAGIPWTVKNLLELKIGTRVLIEGNLLENCWPHGQQGPAFVFTPRENDVSHVTVRYNIIRNVNATVRLSPADFNLSDVLFENNLSLDVAWRGFEVFHAGGRSVNRVTFRHNTALGMGTTFLTLGDHQYSASDLIFQDNIVSSGLYGVHGSSQGAGVGSIQYYCDGYDLDTNVVIAGTAAHYTGDPNVKNTLTPANNSDVGFRGSDFENIANLQLLAGSPYEAAATDGKDIGVDIDSLLAATACAESGACIRNCLAPASPQRLRLTESKQG